MAETAASPDPQKSKLKLMLSALLLLVGVVVAWELVQIKLDQLAGIETSCGEGSGCDKVNASPYSMLFGLPIALYAFPTYVMMLFLAWKGLSSREAAGHASSAVATAALIGLLCCLASVALFIISTSEIGALCKWCVTLYGINLVSTVLLFWAHGKGIGRTLSDGLSCALSLGRPVASALGVLVVTAGIAWAGWDMAREDVEGAVIAKAAKEQAELDALIAQRRAQKNLTKKPVAVAPATGTNAVPTTAKKSTKAKSAATPTKTKTTAAPAKTKGAPAAGAERERPRLDPSAPIVLAKRTKDGYAYFETPLDDAREFWYGNPEAKVTVVKYADFQCGYCRQLANVMNSVKEKYKDRVRFVMRNFPMNPKCNPRMAGYDKHPHACEAAWAGHCAGLQAKFWEMHEIMYANQKTLDETALRGYAGEIGLNLAKYDACMKDPRTKETVSAETRIAIKAGIYGTPRTYVNGRLVTGSASRSVMEYHIERELQAVSADKPAAKGPVKMAPKSDGTAMIAAKSAKGTFYIDPYEASVATDGRAVSAPGVTPAQANWYQAQEACTKAGKRLCSQDEWMSACAGAAQIDENKNRWFSDDMLQGDMYPYGAFYEAGNCQDAGDKYEGRPVKTGSLAKCRTPSGVFDLTGNIGEWVGADKAMATTMGGSASTGERAACNQRSYGSGVGRRNHTTGFRCCADTNVRSTVPSASDLKENFVAKVGLTLPKFTAEDSKGASIDSDTFKGKITLVNFFASWCGPCKKEFPYLVRHQEAFKDKDFQVIAIGVDAQAKRSVEFAEGYDVNFAIIPDPDSKLMGALGVHSMPATFIVDRKGVIRYMDTGFKPDEQAAPLERAIKKLIATP